MFFKDNKTGVVYNISRIQPNPKSDEKVWIFVNVKNNTHHIERGELSLKCYTPVMKDYGQRKNSFR